MKKKTKKQIKPTPEYDSQREQNVLLEKIASDVKTVAEGHGALKQEIGQLRNYVEQRFDRLEMAVTEHSKDIKELKTGVADLQNKAKGLETGQKRIEQKLDTVTTDHEQRLQKIESA